MRVNEPLGSPWEPWGGTRHSWFHFCFIDFQRNSVKLLDLIYFCQFPDLQKVPGIPVG